MATTNPRDYGPLHLITRDDCKRILTLDSITEDVEVNLDQLLIATSTFLAICSERDGLAYIMYEWLTRFGLIASQKRLDSIYYYIFAGHSLVNDVDLEVASLIMGNGDAQDWQYAATVTRFLRRFTYSLLTDIPDCFDKFLKVNRECWTARQRCRVRFNGDPSEGNGRPGYSLILAVKHELEDMLSSWKTPELYGGFSDGSCADGCRTRQEKVEYIVDRTLFYPGTTFFLGSPARRKKWCEATPSMRQVPKTMASRRLIAPEPAWRAYRSYATRVSLEKALVESGASSMINWSDQEVNRDHALIGSITGSYGTIDMTMASDSISRELLFMVFPEKVRPYLADSISDYVYVDKKLVKVNCFSTSGNQLTWLVEAMFFAAVARVASNYVEGSVVLAYGDDLIVSESIYDAVCDLLKTFGCTVNLDKSYNVGPFRESCGAEYFYGVRVTPRYWPRKVIDLRRSYPESMASLCSLQHSLYSHVTARLTLNSVIRGLDPHITYSPVGEECDDLWDAGVDYIESATSHHRHLVTSYGKGTPSQVFEDWQYMEFLRSGPLYASDEDRAWGITSSRMQKGLYLRPSYRWR